VLCNLDIEEYTYHLIFQCPFSERCWNYLGIHWDHGLYFFDTIMKAKREWQFDFFMEVFAIAAWEIWKQRNEKIFRGSAPSFQAWLRSFILTVNQQVYWLNLVNRDAVLAWLQALG
jgi:hypothetical protein